MGFRPRVSSFHDRLLGRRYDARKLALDVQAVHDRDGRDMKPYCGAEFTQSGEEGGLEGTLPSRPLEPATAVVGTNGIKESSTGGTYRSKMGGELRLVAKATNDLS